MPMQAKGPRLWLRRARGNRKALWFIRDGAHFRSTGCTKDDHAGAKKKFLAYVLINYPDGIALTREAHDGILSMRKDRREFIYFIEAGDLVKIGRSINVDDRLAVLQIGSAVKLSLAGMIEGDAEKEAALHRRFGAYREHGEWFRIDGDLGQFLRRFSADAVAQEVAGGV